MSVSVSEIRIASVLNVIFVKLVPHQQFKFYSLLRFIIYSSVHRASSFSINVHAQNIGTQKFLLRKVLREF